MSKVDIITAPLRNCDTLFRSSQVDICLMYLFCSDTLPEGLTRELPSADEFSKLPAPGPADMSMDDLEELKKQLEALNAG